MLSLPHDLLSWLWLEVSECMKIGGWSVSQLETAGMLTRHPCPPCRLALSEPAGVPRLPVHRPGARCGSHAEYFVVPCLQISGLSTCHLMPTSCPPLASPPSSPYCHADYQNQSCHAAFAMSNSGSRTTASLVERDARWRHLAVTWDAADDGRVNVYIDGLLSESSARWPLV